MRLRMTPDNPFLQALLAEPEDDTLRLAMADWLDENDQPGRAEFIRVQIELARGVADRERRCALELRQRDLLIAHEDEWVAPLAKVLERRKGQWGGWVFRRGFVEYFHLPATVINKHGARLARLAPVRELFLRPANAQSLASLCHRHPWMARVTHLYADEVILRDWLAEQLLTSSHLTSLSVLRLGSDELAPPVRKRFRARFPFLSRAS
ncbi:MAG: TIGR02996 domain-containing protein [Planctomycetia bacterium]|nr:TIGR02996 domain-containing protein [Planctomycetia bacterium]